MQRCPHCGRPRSECSDPEKVWYPQREVCYASMEQAASDARYHRLHEQKPWHDGSFAKWAEKPSEGHPYKYDMGVTIGVHDSDLRPTDEFLTKELAPWPPPEPKPDTGEVDRGNSP
jgi:predicted amidophosphoribosyltransferase